jgi:antitoxin component of MazEF toxin-antitoxin module
MKTKIRKFGNSLGIILPKEAISAMKVQEGAWHLRADCHRGYRLLINLSKTFNFLQLTSCAYSPVTAAGKFASAASGASGIGAFVQLYNSESWEKKQVPGGLILDSAVTGSGSTIVVGGTFPISVSHDGGETFSAVESYGGTSQSVNIFGEKKDKFALVGLFVPAGSTPPFDWLAGVLSSVDSGATWQMSESIPMGYARYGAFPSDDVWYVSGGFWGADPTASADGSVPLSSRYQVVNGTLVETPRRPHKRVDEGTPTGWFGYIAKTTDGGKSWAQVFSSDINSDYYYFNSVSTPLLFSNLFVNRFHAIDITDNLCD